MCVAHHYTQTNTNNVDKTCAPNKQLEVSTFIVLLDVTVQVFNCHCATTTDILFHSFLVEKKVPMS